MRMLKTLAAAVFAVALPCVAFAQSTPNLTYGQVPTAAQWNSYFAGKQNTLGFIPINKAGDIMLGELTLAPSGTTGAGLNCGVGVAPASPVNGDVWCSTAGMFVQINGATVGPFVSAAGVVTTLQINLNGAPLPTPQAGALVQAQQANGVVNRIELDSLAAPSTLSGVRKDGTAASPTAILAGDEIVSVNGFGWNGSATVGAAVSFRSYAAETFASGHQGTYARIATTPIASTTLTDVIGFENDGGVTVPPSVAGGSQGAGSINVAQANGIYNGGVAPTGLSTLGYLRAAAPSVTVNGTLCTLGSTCAPTATASSATVGTTTIAGGAAGKVLFDNGTLGEYTITGTGNVVMSASPTITGTLTTASVATGGTETVTSASSLSLAVGSNGATNPVLQVDSSASSQTGGLKISGGASGVGTALLVVDAAGNSPLTINAKGTGTITLGNVSTGAITLSSATTIGAALTYGGVTLSNSVQGTGSMVLSSGPIIAGLSITGSFSAPGLVGLAALAAGTSDTVVGYWGATTASAIAVNNCSGALIFVAHAFGCNTLAGSGTVSAAGNGLTLSGGGSTLGITAPVSAANGGSGVVSPTAHTVPINEGATAQNNSGTATIGQSLQGNGSSADPTFKSGSWTLLNTLPASSSASLADTTSLTSSYVEYEVDITDAVCGTASQDLLLQIGTSGTYATSGYQANIIEGNGSTVSGVTISTGILAAAHNLCPTSGSMKTIVRFANPSAGTTHMFNGYFQQAASNVGGTTGGTTPNQVANDIRLIPSSGVISSGTMKIYGRL